MSENDAKFYEAFKNHMSQYPLSVLQFVRFLDGQDAVVPSETITPLYDAYNMWREATTEESSYVKWHERRQPVFVQ